MKPSVYDFTDAVEFLISWISFARSRSKLSLRGLSLKANIKSSALLPLILKNKKSLSAATAIALARAMALSDNETSYFLALVDRNKMPIQDRETRTIFQQRKSFIPVHYDVMAGAIKVDRQIPAAIAKKFIGSQYQIIGPAEVWGKEKIWSHNFFIDESLDQLRCARNHGHPSKLSKEIIYYPKEPIFQNYGYLYIFWEDPTPQFHALPLSPAFLAGRRTFISDSGLIVEGRLLIEKN